MKKLLLLCALFLLAGCGGEEALDWTPTPAAPSPSPALDLSQDAAWWAGLDPDQLPTAPEDPAYVDGPVSCALFQSAPEEDLFLYEVRCAPYEGAQYLLRRGEVLGEPFRREAPLSADLCALDAGDYDGDGAAEYAISLVHGTGSDLILCELGEEGWTFHTYDPADYSAELSAALDFQYRDGTVLLSYGGESLSYALGLEETGPVEPIEDFSTVAFLSPSGDRITASFGAGAVIGGEAVCFALVLAEVVYDGEGFSLSGLRLVSAHGV